MFVILSYGIAAPKFLDDDALAHVYFYSHIFQACLLPKDISVGIKYVYSYLSISQENFRLALLPSSILQYIHSLQSFAQIIAHGLVTYFFFTDDFCTQAFIPAPMLIINKVFSCLPIVKIHKTKTRSETSFSYFYCLEHSRASKLR